VPFIIERKKIIADGPLTENNRKNEKKSFLPENNHGIQEILFLKSHKSSF